MEASKEELPPALRFYTSDGVLIRPGIKITNYNFVEDTVIRLSHIEDEHIMGKPTGRRVAWWITEKGIFDGSRMQGLQNLKGFYIVSGNTRSM